MGNVSQEPLLSAHKTLKSPCHPIDRSPEPSQLITARLIDSCIKMALRNLLRRRSHLPQRPSNSSNDWNPEQDKKNTTPPRRARP